MPRILWKVSFDTPAQALEVDAEPLSPDDRAAYNQGELRTSCLVLANDRDEALAFGRRLRATWAQLDLLADQERSGSYRRGFQAALVELKDFLRAEVLRWEGEGSNDVDERIRAARHSIVERVSTWAQSFMSPHSAELEADRRTQEVLSGSERVPDTERPR